MFRSCNMFWCNDTATTRDGLTYKLLFTLGCKYCPFGYLGVPTWTGLCIECRVAFSPIRRREIFIVVRSGGLDGVGRRCVVGVLHKACCGGKIFYNIERMCGQNEKKDRLYLALFEWPCPCSDLQKNAQTMELFRFHLVWIFLVLYVHQLVG